MGTSHLIFDVVRRLGQSTILTSHAEGWCYLNVDVLFVLVYLDTVSCQHIWTLFHVNMVDNGTDDTGGTCLL